jgi:hypothetical protein
VVFKRRRKKVRASPVLAGGRGFLNALF